MIQSGVANMMAFARERYQMLLRRRADENALAAGECPQGPPWTEDPVLADHRFCNVFREDDRTTLWMREHLTYPLGRDAQRQLRAAVVFRWFNKIETGELLSDLLLGEWDLEEARARLSARVSEGGTILNAAYMIKSPTGLNKVDGLLHCINVVNRDIPMLASMIVPGETSLRWVHEQLCRYPYLGPFMAYEIVTDLRHTPLLSAAPDIQTWASAGPGAARGLDRVHGDPLGTRSHNSARSREQMVEEMRHILLMVRSPETGLWPVVWPRWEMREVEHTLCEYDKWCRATLGEGRLKQRFIPHTVKE